MRVLTFDRTGADSLDANLDKFFHATVSVGRATKADWLLKKTSSVPTGISVITRLLKNFIFE